MLFSIQGCILAYERNDVKQFIFSVYLFSIPLQCMFNRTLQSVNSPIILQCITDGLQAYQMFTPQNVLQNPPNMIILDINLPRINGLQILKQIKQHPIYKTIPVIVLTTSKRQSQIKMAYGFNATTYFAKPHKPQEFKQLIKYINGYWAIYASFPQFD